MDHNRLFNLFLRLSAVFFLLGAMLSAVPQRCAWAASRYYVNGNGGNDLNSGLSWEQAFKNLQRALVFPNSGDEIWVAQAVYYPDNGGAYPLDSRLATFSLKDGVSIYGGYAGNETSLSQRDIANHPTILSGDVDNNDVNGNGNFIAEQTSNIVGGNAYHVVTSSGNTSTAVLDGFIITAGLANDNSDPNNKGGGVYAYQSGATLRNLSFLGNYAGLGGGAVCVSCSGLSLTNADFANNFALFTGGGLFRNDSSLSLSNVFFGGNVAGSSGGGMDNSASIPLLNTVTFTQNQAPYGGGMANCFSSQADLTNVYFIDNYAATQGGGMYNSNSNTSLSGVNFQNNSSVTGGGMANQNSDPGIIFSTFSGNQANFGGGIWNDNSNSTINYSTFDANSADTGGAIMNLNGSDAWIQNSTFENNQADAGGGMYNYLSSPTLVRVDFDQNQSTSNTSGGGGMFNYTSSPVLSKVNFTNNTAVNEGGGLYNYQGSNPVLTDVNFNNNTANNGGRMRNHAGNNQPQLERVSFVGNTAVYGGGMSNDNSAPQLTNVTFSGNNAHQGGAMQNYQSSPTLINVTFSANAARNAGEGGGMYNISSSQPFLRNVIMADNLNGDCVNGSGGSIAGAYSLIKDTGAYACGAVDGNNGFIVGQDPRLGALGSYGGFTKIYPLNPGSPAIDAVINNWCPATDQRGISRPFGTYCDIGAFEFLPPRVYLPLILR